MADEGDEQSVQTVERPPTGGNIQPQANPWESDPIVKPAGSQPNGPQTESNPWEADPIVKLSDDTQQSMQAHAIHEAHYGAPLPDAGTPTESDSMAPSIMTGEQIPEGQYNQEAAKYSKYQDWLDNSGKKDSPALMKAYFDTYDAENLRHKVNQNTEQWQTNKTAIEGMSPEDIAKGNRGYLGDVMQGVRSASGKVLSTIMRLGGEDDFANQLNRQQSEEAKQMSARPENGFVHDRLRGVVDGVMTMALTAPLGGTGQLATFGAEAANDADTEAVDQGMTGWKRTAYVGGNAAVATFTAGLMQKLGLGSNPKAVIPAATLRTFVVDTAKQVPSFFGMNLASATLKKMAGVDKTEWTAGGVGLLLASAATDAFAFHAAGKGQEAVQKFIDNPSRSNAVDAGFGVQVPKEVREQVAQDAQAQIDQSKRAVTPEKGEPDISKMTPAEIVQAIPDTGKPAREMTEAEKVAKIYRSPIEGMPLANKQAYKEALAATPDAHHGNIDGDALKYVNDAISHEAGDKLLSTMGQIFHEEAIANGIDAYHLSGDEFKMLGKDPDAVSKALQGAKDRLAATTLTYETPDGKVYEHKGLTFGSGVGESDSSAETALKADKDARRAYVAERGQRPAQLVELTPEGRQAVDQRAPTGPERRQPNPAGGSDQGSSPTDEQSQAPAVGRGTEGQGLPPESTQPVQPGNGNPAEAADGAGNEAAPGSGPETAESLANLAHAEIRRRMADEFGLKSTGSKSKDIERYLKAKDESNIVAMNAGLGHAPNLEGVGKGLLRAIGNVRDFIKGGSMPRTSSLDQGAANALIEHASSSIHAKPLAEDLYAKTFGKDDALANRVVEVLTEDNLRGVKDQHLAAGDPKAAAAVHSMVGPKGLWASEAEYQKQLNDPAVLQGIKAWKDNVNNWMDEQYKTTQGISPGQYLPGRGRETGTRLNLMANRPESTQVKGTVSSGGGNPNNPRANYNVFSKQATGASELGYNTVAKDVLANSIDNVLAKSTRLRAIDAMVKTGVGQLLDKNAQWPDNIKGQPVAHLKVDLPTGSGGSESRELLFPKSIEPEVRQAMNTDLRHERSGLLNALNAAQMVGVTDATAHTANMFRAIDASPGGKSLLHDMTVKGLPVARTLDTVTRWTSSLIDISRGTPETKAAIANLARIGAWRGGEHSGLGSAIMALDRAGRVTLDKMFDNLVERGVAVDTDANRREFVNQTGQYNSRLQSKMMAFLKDSAISPFITAGVNYNRLGAKTLVGGSGVMDAGSPAKEALLRSTQIARNVLSPILAGAALTYLVTGGPARKGVPLGAVDTGKDDDKGKPLYVDILGLVRRGLSVTGIGKVIEGVLQGRSKGDIIDSASRDVLNSAIHPLAGPAVKFGLEAGFGAKPGSDLGWATPKAAPGESQRLSDLKHAVADINPLAKGGIEAPSGAGEKVGGVVKAAEDAVKNAVGIKSGRVPLSPAAELAQEFYRQRMGEKRYTEEQQQAHDLRTQITKDVRGGMSRDAAIKKAEGSGKVTSKEALASAKAGEADWGTTTFKRLTAEEAKNVLAVATPEEKAQWQPLMDKKIQALEKAAKAPYSLRIKDKEAWKANKATAKGRLDKLNAQ